MGQLFDLRRYLKEQPFIAVFYVSVVFATLCTCCGAVSVCLICMLCGNRVLLSDEQH